MKMMVLKGLGVESRRTRVETYFLTGVSLVSHWQVALFLLVCKKTLLPWASHYSTPASKAAASDSPHTLATLTQNAIKWLSFRVDFWGENNFFFWTLLMLFFKILNFGFHGLPYESLL